MWYVILSAVGFYAALVLSVNVWDWRMRNEMRFDPKPGDEVTVFDCATGRIVEQYTVPENPA